MENEQMTQALRKTTAFPSRKVKRTSELDIATLEEYAAENSVDAYDLMWRHPLVENEDGNLVAIETEWVRDPATGICTGIVWIVTDFLENGWMVESRFFPDGTVETHKTR